MTTGTYRMKMKITADIPSTLIVSKYKLEVFYYGQKQTCWTCGMEHQKGSGQCPNNYREYVNRFSIDDFPPIESSTLVAPKPSKPAREMTTDEFLAERMATAASVRESNTESESVKDTSDHTYANAENTSVAQDDTTSNESPSDPTDPMTTNDAVQVDSNNDVDMITPVSQTSPKTSTKNLDISESEGAISRAYDQYVVKSPNHQIEGVTITEVQIHQNVGVVSEDTVVPTGENIATGETTETASESDQCILEFEEAPKGTLWTLIGDNSSDKKKRVRVPRSSSDDEQSKGNIVYNLGSFVNSFMPSYGNRQVKKSKKDPPDSSVPMKDPPDPPVPMKDPPDPPVPMKDPPDPPDKL